MPISTAMLANMATVITNGPATVTKASALAAAGPIMDYVGACKLAYLKMQSATNMVANLISVTNSGDTTNYGYLANCQKLLTNAGIGTASAHVLTDMTALFIRVQAGTGMGATTKAAIINPAGPLMDYVGNVSLLRKMLQEVQVLVTLLYGVTDSTTDATNYGLLGGLLLALV